MKRLLIADDSALVRKQISEIVAELGFEVDTARNGAEAVEKALSSQYDVITMDINMPVMDGITAVRKIMQTRPTPILMVSSLTTESAKITMEALDAGAVDYIAKPGTMNVGRDENSAEIVQKVTSLSRIPPRRLKNIVRRSVIRKRPEDTRNALREEHKSNADVTKILLIGASTGGPGLIEQICNALPSTFEYAVCIVQHMPEQFTASFATRLDKNSTLPVVESSDQMELYPGNIYLARGGVHMHFSKKVTGRVVIREEKIKGERFFQPSVDEMFLSALKIFRGDQITGVLLTGIGDDGAEGMVKIKQEGGFTIGESEETATVYGMPKEAYDRGGVSQQLSFPKIVRTLQTLR